MSLIPPKTPSRRRKSAFPPYRFMLCRSHPLRGAIPQRSSAALVFRALTRGLCFDKWFPAMRNCVSNGVRTSRCRADFLRLSKSRCGLPSRRAPDRLAALLAAFRLIYRVLPAPGFHRWDRPNFRRCRNRTGPMPNGCTLQVLCGI